MLPVSGQSVLLTDVNKSGVLPLSRLGPPAVLQTTVIRFSGLARKKAALPGAAKTVNSFQYKGRKAGQHHVVPSAPFLFNDGGRQSSKRPRQQNDARSAPSRSPALFPTIPPSDAISPI